MLPPSSRSWRRNLETVYVNLHRCEISESHKCYYSIQVGHKIYVTPRNKEANSHSAGQEITLLLRNLMFITVFTTARLKRARVSTLSLTRCGKCEMGDTYPPLARGQES